MRKKIFILAGVACLAFTGCGNGNNQGSNIGTSANSVVATEEADVPLYYSIGKGTLTISKDMTVQDCIDYETLPDGVESNYEALPDSITKQYPDCWTEAYTVVTVKDGEIVKIVRNWRP